MFLGGIHAEVWVPLDNPAERLLKKYKHDTGGEVEYIAALIVVVTLFKIIPKRKATLREGNDE